jgi:hypothetical protein
MFTIYKTLSLTFLTLFLSAMTLVPLYSSLVMVKSTKESKEGSRLTAPQSKDDITASYY